MKKRLLGILLSVVMCLSLLPAAAFASDSGDGSGLGKENAWDVSADGNGSVIACLSESNTPLYRYTYDNSGTDAYVYSIYSFEDLQSRGYYSGITLTNSEEIQGYDLYIEGSGNMKDFTVPDADGTWRNTECWGTDAYSGRVLNVTVGEGVTSIGANAFYYVSITGISLPSTITKLGEAALLGCFNYNKCNDYVLITPEACTNLNKNVFARNSALKTVELSNCLMSLPENAFYLSTGIKEITFPSTLTTIYQQAFRGCSNLRI